MFLVFRFIPGESVTIGGVAFGVVFSPPSLTRPDRLPIPIGADPVRLPKAEVRLSGRQASRLLGYRIQGTTRRVDRPYGNGECAVKRPQFPGSNHYVFELTLGIHGALTFSPGDISTLFVDGLFALDEEGKLFPGVTVPKKRLHLAGMEPMGYHRFGRRGTLQDTYGEVTFSSDELPKTTRELRDRLDVAVGSLDAAIPHQRMLMAKLSTLTDRCHHPGALTQEDRRTAQALLAAAETIIAAVEAATKPVL